MPDRDCAAIGWQYAEDVVAGRIPNGQWAIKACQRPLDDRRKLTGFRFDPQSANRVTSFVEWLSHVKGRLGGQLIRLDSRFTCSRRMVAISRRMPQWRWPAHSLSEPS
jgi:hypothetical protein